MTATARSTHDPFVGSTVLQRYRIASHLRSDARGDTYEAVGTDDERALLRMLPRAVFSPSPRNTWTTLWAWAERLQRLDHPNVERVLDCGVAQLGEADQFCVASEAVTGDTLLAHVRASGRLGVADALTLGRQIAQGMAALHKLDVLHGDLRATNILVAHSASNDGADARPIVCEAGLTALTFHADTSVATLRAMRLSPESIAPEQIRGEPATAATDIYAFGTVLYRMLTGVAAFHADNTSQTLLAHLTRTAPPLADHAGDVPTSVEALVRRCLARRPEDRFPSFDVLLASLQECEATVLSIASNRSPSWVSPLLYANDPSTGPRSRAPRALSNRPRLSPPPDTDDPGERVTRPSLARPRSLRPDDPAPPLSAAPPRAIARIVSVTPAETHLSVTARDATAVPSLPTRASLAPDRPVSRHWVHLAVACTLLLGVSVGFVVSALRTQPRAPQVAAPMIQATAVLADTVRVEVRSATRNATVVLRGRSYPAPIELELSRGSEPEMVEVSAPAHVARRVWLVLDRSLRTELTLDPEAPAAPIETAPSAPGVSPHVAAPPAHHPAAPSRGARIAPTLRGRVRVAAPAAPVRRAPARRR